MRYLITGFEPFGGESINSSQETVNAVASDEFGDIEIVRGLLPVSFKRSGIAMCGLIDETEPDVVIMLGVFIVNPPNTNPKPVIKPTVRFPIRGVAFNLYAYK